MEHRSCRSPDRDSPKLSCGYPLPCPHHTAIIDASTDPAIVTIPVTSEAMKSPARERLGAIGRAVTKGRVTRVTWVVKRGFCYLDQRGANRFERRDALHFLTYGQAKRFAAKWGTDQIRIFRLTKRCLKRSVPR